MRTSAIELAPHEQASSLCAPNFNHLARVYRWMEWITFGPFLQRCRCAFLSAAGRRRHALVLGDGDGRFTARMIQTNPDIQVDAVDASSGMLSQLARRSSSSRVRVHVADARLFAPAEHHYDLVATHFFLDCLTISEIENLASRIRNHVRPDAVWLISEFAIPSNLYGKFVARPLVSALYIVFGFLTNLRVRELPDHRMALAEAGWTLMEQKRWLAGLLISERWKLSREN